MKYINDETEIYIHLGFHKTATTHLQDILEFHCFDLLSQNALFLTRFDIRPLSFQEALNQQAYTKCNQILEQAIENKFSFYNQPINRFILSEENLAGGIKLIHTTSKLYPALINNVGNLIKLFPNQKLTILFGIRSFSDFLPSIYGEILRHNTFFSFNNFIKKINIENLSWFDLILSLQKKYPSINIRVFLFESYIIEPIQTINKAFRTSVASIDEYLFKEFQSTKSYDTESLSEKAYNTIHDLNQEVKMPSIYARQIMSRYPTSLLNPKIAIKDEPLAKALEARYRSDVDRLKQAKLLM